jgi:hypothetical protein
MPTLHFHETTTSTPEQFVAGLTDFGPGRSKLFANSADGYLEVYSQGTAEADVKEGSGGVWERGAATQATPIRSSRIPMGRPTSISSPCARGRTSGGASSGS